MAHRRLVAVVLLLLVVVASGDAAGTADGSEQWGYVEVRPRAHVFWWLYLSPHRVTDIAGAPWPTVLWLQGGPGASGVGYGDFTEIGPLDADLQPRASTWLQKADLLFVDHPVGTGYSFVEDGDQSLYVKTDNEAADDLVALLKKLYNENAQLQESPVFIVAESYGGKFAVTGALAILRSVNAGELHLKLGGVALGDSWISPEDYVVSWSPLLLDLSRLDSVGAEKAAAVADKAKEQIKNGQWADAEASWDELEEVIIANSNNVDFYDFLKDSDPDDAAAVAAKRSPGGTMRRYGDYLSTKVSSDGDLSSLMNGPVKEKLKIIPKNVSWGGQGGYVFDALKPDFMKPRIAEVDELLALGVNVTVYNGQVDLICATKGTEAWMQKLKWEGLKNFTSTSRAPLYCDGDTATKGFLKSYRNLNFYWILGAGHFVPVDQPCIALKMLGEITRSPAEKKAVIQ